MTARQQAIISMYGMDITDSVDLRNESSIVGWSFPHHTTLEELQTHYSDEQIEQLYDESLQGEAIPSENDNVLVGKVLDDIDNLEDEEYDPDQYKASLGDNLGEDSIKPYQK